MFSSYLALPYLLLCLFSLCSCQKPHQNERHQNLNLNIVSDPATLDPRKGGDLTSSLFHFLLFDGLVSFDESHTLHLALAEKVDLSADRTVYTFYLRDALWSNGTPITAWDFEKSWKDILHPDFPSMNAHLLYPIKNAEKVKTGKASVHEVGIQALDAKTLEVTLEQPTPYFLELVAFCVFFPVDSETDHVCPKWDQLTGKEFVCSGRFILKEWKHSNKIILETNPLYYNLQSLQIKQLNFNIVANEMTSLQMFEKGEVDVLGQPFTSLPTDAIPSLLNTKQFHMYPLAASSFCSFNTEAFPFNNALIRKAFAYAIHREEIVKNITQLNEQVALNLIPPLLSLKPAKPIFKDGDVQIARDLFEKGLAELSITREQFPKVKLVYAVSESDHKIAQVLQQQWHQALGVHIELENVDKKILLNLLKSRSYQIAQTFWIAQYNDPMNFFERFKYRSNVKNYPSWENPLYISLLNQSSLAKTRQERADLLEQAEHLFLDEMPIAPLFHWKGAFITQPYIKNRDMIPIEVGFFDHAYIDWEIREKLR